MRNMGIPLKVEPQELVLESDMMNEDENNKDKLEINDAIDIELQKYMKEEKELEKEKERYENQSNKSYKSRITDKEVMK